MARVWAKLEFAQWLDLMEIGAYGTWFLAHKSKDRSDAQVRTKVPLSGQTTTTNATIARVIANAKPGQQARTLDRNPLNLRRANIFIIGKAAQGERPAGRAKTDTRAQLQEHKAIAQSLSGRGYGPKLDGQQ
ncbi:MAG TPA: hypothetical protein PLH11_04185 [Gemmobacter sp.]|nr:hypothetical protein [Gemmobacter sp.]